MEQTSYKNNDLASHIATIVKQISEVKRRIDSLEELYGFDLSKAKSTLADILTDFLQDISHSKILNVYSDKLLEPIFEAYRIILDGLIEDVGEYAKKLDDYLINTGSLRKAINRAKRQSDRARVSFFVEKKLNEGINILEKEIENLCTAKSDMEANEPDEKRKMSFRLVKIYISFFLGLLVPYFYYTTIFRKIDPLQPDYVFSFGAVYFFGCVIIYIAIGAIAKVGHREKEE